jgi:Spy/CpxP family protein refolding chaperone
MIKQKLLVLFASVIAMTAVPVMSPVMAQSAGSTPSGVTAILKQLNLTPDQQKRVDEIQALAAVQIKAVLTPEQLVQFKAMADEGRSDADSFNALNLTDGQKTKLKEVQTDIALQLLPVLSGDQQQKLIEAVTAGKRSQ